MTFIGHDGHPPVEPNTQFHEQMQMKLAQWMLLFSLVVGTLVMTQSHAIAQQKPLPRMEISGVNFRDKFDLIFSKSFGCLTRAMIKWRRDGGSTRSYRCVQADEFLQIILEQKNNGTSIESYLRSKGGACGPTDGGMMHCWVEREVVWRIYSDEMMPANANRTLFVLHVDVRESDGQIYTDIEREDFAPGERRG